MGKMVGMAEFKANCTRLLRELGEDGEPITVTSRGKPVATIAPPPTVGDQRLGSAFGFLKSNRYRFDADPEAPACDPDEWDALR